MPPKLGHVWVIFVVIAAWKRIYLSIEPASNKCADQQFKVGEPLLQIQYTFGNCRICGCSGFRNCEKCAFRIPDNSRSQMCPGMTVDFKVCNYAISVLHSENPVWDILFHIFLSNFESQLSQILFSRFPASSSFLLSQFCSLALMFWLDFLQFLSNPRISFIHVSAGRSPAQN